MIGYLATTKARNRVRSKPPTASTDCGSILVVALVVTSCVLAAGLGMLTLSAADRAMSSNFRRSAIAAYAAETTAAYVVDELTNSGAWTGALSSGAHASFSAPSPVVTTPSGEVLDLTAETLALQRRTNTEWPRGPDTPIWRLFASGPMSALTGTAVAGDNPYVVAWVGDNPADSDADPAVDSDGIIVIRAHAWLGEARTSVLLFVVREIDDSFVSGSNAAGTDSTTGTASTGLAQIMPQAQNDPSVATRVRIVSWREVP